MIDLLIAEDRPDEATRAERAARDAGVYSSIVVVSDAEEALSVLDRSPRYVLTDLFMPGGRRTPDYVAELLPHFDAYVERRFPRIPDDNPVKLALQTCADVFGMEPEQYLTDVMSLFTEPAGVMEAARDAVVGRRNSEGYERFASVLEAVREGRNIPAGLFVARAARTAQIPCVIVTSTYHHDDAFEAVSNLVQVPYVDTLVDGHKDWDAGLRMLANR